MANYFDKYDEQDKETASKGNYFDKYDKQDKEAHQKDRAAGLAKRAGVEGLIEGVGGIPALAGDVAYNAGNFVRNRFVDESRKGEYGMPVSRKLSEVAGGAANALDLPTPDTSAEKIGVALGKGGISALTGGGLFKVGAMGAQALNAGRTGGLLESLGSNLGQQAAAGAISGGTTEGLNEAGVNPLISGAAGLIAGPASIAMGRRIATPNVSNLTPEQARLAQIFQEEVGPMSAGQTTGKKWLQTAEDQISKLPMGDLLVENPRAGQTEAFTQAALKRAGVDAEAATPDVLDKGFKDIGQTIGDITGKYKIQFDPQYAKDIHDLSATYGINLTKEQQGTIKDYLNRIHANGGTLDGEQYQRIRSQLSRLARGQNGPQASVEYRSALIDLRESLDDAMSRTIGRIAPNSDDLANLSQARQQYANLNVVSDAVNRSGQAGTAGLLSPQALAGALKSSIGKRNFATGKGDLNDLARSGSQFLATPPSSGTAERAAVLDYAKMIAGGAAGGGLGMGVPGGIAGAVGGAALPFMAQLGVNSPLMQMYLRNQRFANPANTAGNISAGLLGGMQ